MLDSYDKAIKDSSVWKELVACRNVRPSFSTAMGLWGGYCSSLSLTWFSLSLSLSICLSLFVFISIYIFMPLSYI